MEAGGLRPLAPLILTTASKYFRTNWIYQDVKPLPISLQKEIFEVTESDNQNSKAPVKSPPFYRPDALSVTQPTA